VSNLYPEGFFDATVTGGQFGQTGNGKAQWAIDFTLDDGTKRTAYLSYEGGSKPYTTEKLQRLGFNGDVDNPVFESPQCQMGCKHEEYNGATKEKWDVGRGLQMAPPSADMRNEFRRDWKATAAQPVGKPTGAPATPPTRSAAPKSAPSRPAPASSAPGRPNAAPSRSDPATVKDKDWAWNEIKKTTPPKQDNFFETIDRVAADTGIAEDDFGPEQWSAVVAGYLPI
jgi:pyruvate/2-oxoglutarate dehydrogenase complex dihydrolipoamide acyltransferase (E2) component